MADFRLGHLLRDERYDETIAQRTYDVARVCRGSTPTPSPGHAGKHCLAHGRAGGVRLHPRLYDSASASGAEHHLSHFWEMLLLRKGRPAIPARRQGGRGDGADCRHLRTGAACRAEVADRLEASTLPDRAAELAAIDAAYGAEAEAVARTHGAFLDMTLATHDTIKRASPTTGMKSRPSPPRCRRPPRSRLLEIAGGPTTVSELGFSRRKRRWRWTTATTCATLHGTQAGQSAGLDQERSLL